ncbi:MAG: hypothetical protein ACK4SJ_11870, partial [Sphingorhabdus sp.]
MAGSLPTSQIGKTGREAGEAVSDERLHLATIAAGVLLSLLLVWLVSDDAILVAITAGGLIGLGGFLFAALRFSRPAAGTDETTPPD